MNRYRKSFFTYQVVPQVRVITLILYAAKNPTAPSFRTLFFRVCYSMNYPDQRLSFVWNRHSFLRCVSIQLAYARVNYFVVLWLLLLSIKEKLKNHLDLAWLRKESWITYGRFLLNINIMVLEYLRSFASPVLADLWLGSVKLLASLRITTLCRKMNNPVLFYTLFSTRRNLRRLLRGTLLRCTTPIFFILISFDRLYSSSPKPKILSAINLFSSGNTYFPITFFTYIQKYENPHNYLENTIPYPNLH